MNKTRKYLFSPVRFLIVVMALSITISAAAYDSTVVGESTEATILLAQAESCVASCAAKKKSCMAKYTRTNINGIKFVTPEGVKLCSAAFRECKSYCK